MQVEADVVTELRCFWVNEEGQDLVEYTLLVSVMTLGAVSLLKNQGTSVSMVWGGASATMHNAAVGAG